MDVVFWEEVKFATEEEDTGTVVGEISEATVGRLDRLDAAVEALSGTVADAVAELTQNVFQPTFEHLRHALHWFQLAA